MATTVTRENMKPARNALVTTVMRLISVTEQVQNVEKLQQRNFSTTHSCHVQPTSFFCPMFSHFLEVMHMISTNSSCEIGKGKLQMKPINTASSIQCKGRRFLPEQSFFHFRIFSVFVFQFCISVLYLYFIV